MTPGAAPDEDLAGRISHAVRTPLSIVVGYAELLKLRGDEQTRQQAATQILAAADRLWQSIDEVVVAYALDTDALVLDLAPVDLAEAVRGAAAAAEARADGARVTTSASAADSPVRVVADPGHLARVLAALIGAVCATQEDGCDVSVAVDLEDEVARVSVSRAGGAGEAIADAGVFERFSPVAQAGGGSGAGVGLELYNARRLVELHGGSIGAVADADGHTGFSFTLPLAR